MKKSFVIVDDATNQPVGVWTYSVEQEQQVPAFNVPGQHIVNDDVMLEQFLLDVEQRRAARNTQ